MRCNNCGWDNPAGLSKCEKCNSPLESNDNYYAAPCGNNPGGTVVEDAMSSSPSLSKTVRESSVFNFVQGNPTSPNVCPNCGYQLRNNVSVCPNCRQPIGGGNGKTVPEQMGNTAPAANKFNSTVRPKCNFVTEVGFSLTPIANEGEFKTPAKVDFDEEHVELNRANIDPNNRTITSKVQAVMHFDEGKRCWSIQDKSAQRYTFVLCKNEMPLADGDILLIGDRKFEFRPFGQQSSDITPMTGTLIMGRQQSNMAGCRLVPLAYPGENDAPAECQLKGTFHELNRELLEADNFTITSKVQAELTFKDGSWYVKDRSSLHTTYILCAEPIILKDGDTILMGNRNFIFNC